MEEQEQQQPPKPPEATQDQIASLKDASKTLNSFGVVIFFVIIAEVILLMGLNFYQDARVDTLGLELTELRSKLSSAEYRTINGQVEEVISGTERLQTVLNSKVKWSKFYQTLGLATPKDVKLSTINISADGSFKADGETNSMTSLAQALVTWNTGTPTIATPFNIVKLNSNGFISTDTGRRISFTISGQINLGRLR